MNLAQYGVYFAIALFMIGLLGLITRKNIFFMLLSVEVMLNSANLMLICASKLTNTIDGQIFALFVIGIAACEAVIGLALVVAWYKLRARIESDDLSLLRG